MRVGGRKWRFSLLSLAISSEPSHLLYYITSSHLLYCAMWPISGSSMIPKQMTLNDLEWRLFRARQLMGWHLRLSDKTVRKFAELHINYTVSDNCDKNVSQGT